MTSESGCCSGSDSKPLSLTPVEIEKREKLRREKPRVYEKIMDFDRKIAAGESIAIIQFQYNYACNFRCQHCDITELRDTGKREHRRKFTIPDVRELSRQADEMGLAHLVITGGEPLIFRDFDDLVEAIDPQKFYITSDTNGWHLDYDRAKHLKAIGVEKIQLSIDSLNAEEHDAFRRAPGSHARTLRAIDAAQEAGLALIVQTVVTKQRIRSTEFTDFLKYLNGRNVPVFVTYAKPVGEWQGHTDELVTKEDMAYMRELEKDHNVFTHLTPSYGHDLGCIAVKRMFSITQFGDVMPCPYIHASLGNVFNEPLRNIVERGMNTKHFGLYQPTCLVAEDRDFLSKYVGGRIDGKPLPVPYDQVFTPEDLIRPLKKDEPKVP